jgi:hypothetical protein
LKTARLVRQPGHRPQPQVGPTKTSKEKARPVINWLAKSVKRPSPHADASAEFHFTMLANPEAGYVSMHLFVNTASLTLHVLLPVKLGNTAETQRNWLHAGQSCGLPSGVWPGITQRLGHHFSGPSAGNQQLSATRKFG